MKTSSILIQSLCVPCFNHCRYCLLSLNGTTEGAGWDQSVRIAERFLKEYREKLPDVSSGFSFGYSMEHPDLKEAIRTLRRLGGPSASFLQCDGMKMRSDAECGELMDTLLSEGIKQLNFTIYGLADYHDLFAGRKGDYELMLRMMKAAESRRLPFRSGIPLTAENISQINTLVGRLKDIGNESIFLFIPHEEGRGKQLSRIRLDLNRYLQLSPESQALLNRSIYRTEAEWLRSSEEIQEQQRMILISLRTDNMEEYEKQGAMSVLREIEALDESYYSSFPAFRDLAARYGDPCGNKLYRFRDLYYHYRTRYSRDHGIHVYDVADERQSGSRRY